MLDLSGVGAPAASLDPAALLSNLSAGDPNMAMLLQLMQARAPSVAQDAPGKTEQNRLIDELTERLAAAEARLSHVTRVAKGLHEAQQAGAARLAELAAALGACGLCWGEDDACPCCRGRGRPGMVRPDPGLRARYFGQLKRREAHDQSAQPPAARAFPEAREAR